MSETDLSKAIREALNTVGGCHVVRVQSGTARGGKMKLAPEGTPDIVGYRKSDGRAVYVEAKTPTGRLSEAQALFLARARDAGCCAGVARSVVEALRLVGVKCG